MLGAVDIDLPGADINLDGDVDLDIDGAGSAAELGGVGLLAARWLNIAKVPLLLWCGVFSIGWWFISAMLWVTVDVYFFSPPGWLWSTLLVIRNVAIAVLATKFITGPMCKWFESERLTAASIVGQECSISSLEATPDFGQVKFKTNGSPLLLNVRTDGPHLAQGARVWITHYDAKRRVYIVSPTGTDSPSEAQDQI